jgi:hypothetical protein
VYVLRKSSLLFLLTSARDFEIKMLLITLIGYLVVKSFNVECQRPDESFSFISVFACVAMVFVLKYLQPRSLPAFEICLVYLFTTNTALHQ